MYVQGSLLAAIQQHATNAHKMALLVIDESPVSIKEVSSTPGKVTSSSNVTAYQQRLLCFMQRLGSPVWSIRFMNLMPSFAGGPDDTRIELRGLYNGQERLLRKKEPNAFRETSLHADLQILGINRLVVMGFHANACIEATVGSKFWPVGTVEDGATHLGYQVMTCDQVLHGGPANWSHASQSHLQQHLEFYSSF